MQIPNSVARGIARLGLTLRLPLPFDPHVVPYATRYWFVNSQKAQDELGVTFRPARETLRSALGWLCAAGHIRSENFTRSQVEADLLPKTEVSTPVAPAPLVNAL